MTKNRQKIINDESQVPEGFVRMIEMGSDWSGRLSTAAIDGTIRSVRLMRYVDEKRGAVYVHKEDAQAFIDRPREGAIKRGKHEAPSFAGQLTRIEEKLDKLLSDLGVKVSQ